jgi:hypothetical protein
VEEADMADEPDEKPGDEQRGRDAAPDPSQPLERLKSASKALKEKIEEEKRRQNMPIDSTLGDPAWDEKARDGRFDRKDGDDDE